MRRGAQGRFGLSSARYLLLCPCPTLVLFPCLARRRLTALGSYRWGAFSEDFPPHKSEQAIQLQLHPLARGFTCAHRSPITCLLLGLLLAPSIPFPRLRSILRDRG